MDGRDPNCLKGAEKIIIMIQDKEGGWRSSVKTFSACHWHS